MERILQQVLHNKAEERILITISDTVSAETLKRIYNLLLDEEIKIDQSKNTNAIEVTNG